MLSNLEFFVFFVVVSIYKRSITALSSMHQANQLLNWASPELTWNSARLGLFATGPDVPVEGTCYEHPGDFYVRLGANQPTSAKNQQLAKSLLLLVWYSCLIHPLFTILFHHSWFFLFIIDLTLWLRPFQSHCAIRLKRMMILLPSFLWLLLARRRISLTANRLIRPIGRFIRHHDQPAPGHLPSRRILQVTKIRIMKTSTTTKKGCVSNCFISIKVGNFYFQIFLGYPQRNSKKKIFALFKECGYIWRRS